jgi:hypothetical protein
MPRNYVENVCLKAPGLAIKTSSSPTVKYANTFAVKANGIISVDTTTADAPALSTSKGVNNAASSNLADDYQRVYTLLAAVNATTGVITCTWVHGNDFAVGRAPKMSDINFGNPENDDEQKAVVGFLVVKNQTGADFVPGTTALDDATEDNITAQYIDNYGFIGM